MNKTIKTFDGLSVLFGASVVILAISIFLATKSITKKSISDREATRLLEMEINYLHNRIDDLESRGSLKQARIIEKLLSEIMKGTQAKP
tara:strand:- start:157 stop:423 length:267 start_codon:yes stop_codon:yes gene_type:complete